MVSKAAWADVPPASSPIWDTNKANAAKYA